MASNRLLFECKAQSCLAALFLLVIFGYVPRIHAQSATAEKPRVSDQPLTEEQLDIYRVILNRWMGSEVGSLNLADVTETFPTDGAFGSKDCLKGLDIETGQAGIVHRFRPEDLAKLGPARIRLVDDKAQEKEVAKHDPGKAIREGRSVDDAVKDGFAHGKAWFSEILFDKTHTHAVVFYGFHCGQLCGNGGTAILEKKDGSWTFKSQCSTWMS